MEESLPPPDSEGNIFEQFEVHVNGELLPGGASVVDGYVCRLPPCCGDKKTFRERRALIMHRRRTHSLPHNGTYKIPDEDQIHEWLLSGKPRPYEIPEHSPVRTKPRDRPARPPGSSLLSKLQHCNPDTESELQPASLDSNIYEQFDVRPEPGVEGGSTYVGYVCLLSHCHKEKVCLNSYEKWTRHRRRVHMATEDKKLPNGYDIRHWVAQNKPRPYDIVVGRRSKAKSYLDVDPDVFAEFDVKGTVEDEQLQFSCLIHPCKVHGVSFRGRKNWTIHRGKHHMFPKYKDGTYILPSEEMIKDWINAGKPPHYIPQRPSAKMSTELHNPELDPTPSNVICQSHIGNEVDPEKALAFCLLLGCEKPEKCLSGGHYFQRHLQKMLSREERPSLRTRKSWARLSKFRSSMPPAEIPRESRLRGRRPRNADAAGCSSDTEPDHEKKKKKRSHSSHSTVRCDSDSSDLVAVNVVGRGEDPSGDLWKQFREKTNPTCDDTASCDDGSEDVDDQSMEQTMEDPNHDYNSADMEEFGEKAYEDSVAPEDSLPSLPYSQPELHDSGAAEMVEVDEDAHEVFEAGTPDNVLPSQSELKIIKVVGHSSVQSQDFQGVTDEHQQNSEIADVREEAPKDSVAPENVLPSPQLSQPELPVTGIEEHTSVRPHVFQGETDELQQNSKMGEVDEGPEDFVALENALTVLTYSQPTSWEHSRVQPQDFRVIDETLPNPTAEMAKVEEEAPEDSVAIKNVLSSLSCLHQEFGVTGNVEHDNVLPQDFQEMAEFGEAHEEFINPWKLNPSVQSDVSEQNQQIPLSPLWHLDGDTLQCLPQDSPAEKYWPNSSKEDNLKYSAEIAEVGEETLEEIAAVGNLSPSVQSQSSEQNVNALSPLLHYFENALQFSTKDSPGETYNNRPNSTADMAEVGEEAPDGFVAPGNFVPWTPLIQLEGTEVSSLDGPIENQAAPIQESVPLVHMDPVFINEPNAAGMAEEAPVVFVAPVNFAPWISLMPSEGTKVPSLEVPVDLQTLHIQESVLLVQMDPVFINEPNAAGMGEAGGEVFEELSAPGSFAPLLPSVQPQETGEQLYLSSLNTNASSQDPRNIRNDPIIQEYPQNPEFINTVNIASMNESAVVVPLAPSTQPEGTEIRSMFMEGSAGKSRENHVDPVQELTTLMDVERASGAQTDFPVIDVGVEKPDDLFRREAVAHSPQPMQELFSPGNSESSNNFIAVLDLQIDPLIDMNSGLEYELRMLLQPNEMPAWLFNC